MTAKSGIGTKYSSQSLGQGRPGRGATGWGGGMDCQSGGCGARGRVRGSADLDEAAATGRMRWDVVTGAVQCNFLPVQSRPGSQWYCPEECGGKVSHWLLWAEREVEFYTSPDRQLQPLRAKRPRYFAELILFLSWADSDLRTGIMIGDNICHCADLKRKVGLNIQAKSIRKNWRQGSGFTRLWQPLSVPHGCAPEANASALLEPERSRGPSAFPGSPAASRAAHQPIRSISKLKANLEILSWTGPYLK